MERQKKRGRRGKGQSFGYIMPNLSQILQQPQKRNIVHCLTSFLILISLTGIVYLMLDYHCYSCSAKNNMMNITKNIEELSQNLSVMNNHYYDLEMQIMHFTQEFPKVEKQIKALEELASIVEHKEKGWDPKVHCPLPNVDVYLNNPVQQ